MSDVWDMEYDHAASYCEFSVDGMLECLGDEAAPLLERVGRDRLGRYDRRDWRKVHRSLVRRTRTASDPVEAERLARLADVFRTWTHPECQCGMVAYAEFVEALEIMVHSVGHAATTVSWVRAGESRSTWDVMPGEFERGDFFNALSVPAMWKRMRVTLLPAGVPLGDGSVWPVPTITVVVDADVVVGFCLGLARDRLAENWHAFESLAQAFQGREVGTVLGFPDETVEMLLTFSDFGITTVPCGVSPGERLSGLPGVVFLSAVHRAGLLMADRASSRVATVAAQSSEGASLSTIVDVVEAATVM